MADDLDAIRQRKRIELMKENAMAENDFTSDKPLHLSSKNFKSTLEGYKGLLVVDFWAPWCMPCRMLTPVIEELAKDYKGKVLFGKVNTDENQQISMQYGIRGIPALIFFKDQKEVGRLVGARPRQDIEATMTQLANQ